MTNSIYPLQSFDGGYTKTKKKDLLLLIEHFQLQKRTKDTYSYKRKHFMWNIKSEIQTHTRTNSQFYILKNLNQTHTHTNTYTHICIHICNDLNLTVFIKNASSLLPPPTKAVAATTILNFPQNKQPTGTSSNQQQCVAPTKLYNISIQCSSSANVFFLIDFMDD